MDWRDDRFVWVGWDGGDFAWRTVLQHPDGSVWIRGQRSSADDDWAEAVLGIQHVSPAFTDPVLQRLRCRLAGLAPFAYGSLYEGLIAAIVGQSISVMAAAVAQTRLCAMFAPSIERSGRSFWPLPRPDDLAAADAALVRQAGVTWRRASALIAAAQAEAEGQLPTRIEALLQPDAVAAKLLELPGVGPWTANSVLLWGIGAPDAHPTGDVALLRAARAAYARPDLDLRGLDRLAEGWRPARGWAARLLWTDLLGVAG